jgi:hypothetical protein
MISKSDFLDRKSLKNLNVFKSAALNQNKSNFQKDNLLKIGDFLKNDSVSNKKHRESLK